MLGTDYADEIFGNAPPGWCANALGYDLLEPEDVAKTMLWLASSDAHAVTGSTIAFEAGQLIM